MSIRKYRVAMVLAVVCGTALAVTATLYAADDAPWTAPARAARKPNPVPSDDTSIAAGKVVYTQQCFSCHGAAGKGDGPAAKDLEKNPGDLSKPALWDQTDGALFWKLTEGKKPMPAFATLTTETQRWQVINYVRTLAPKPAGTAPSQPATP